MRHNDRETRIIGWEFKGSPFDIDDDGRPVARTGAASGDTRKIYGMGDIADLHFTGLLEGEGILEAAQPAAPLRGDGVFITERDVKQLEGGTAPAMDSTAPLVAVHRMVNGRQTIGLVPPPVFPEGPGA